MGITRMERICARCGRLLSEHESIGPLCLSCYLETYRVLCVPDRVNFEYCKHCGSIRAGHKWVEGGELDAASSKFLKWYLSERVTPCSNDVAEYSLVSVEPVTTPSWRTIYRATFSVKLRGIDSPASVQYSIDVRAKPTICPACKDVRGGDYSVLLQVRGETPKKLAELLSPVIEASNQIMGSIVDIIEYSNGVDFLLLDRGSASKIVRQLKKHYRLRVHSSGEDVGVTSRGRMRRRLVLSVHLEERRR